MRRTKVNVFLVAMAILPFLQNMLPNIGTGHYIHDMYVYSAHYLSPNFSQKIIFFRHFRKNLSRDRSLHTQRIPKAYAKETLSWALCSTLICTSHLTRIMYVRLLLATYAAYGHQTYTLPTFAFPSHHLHLRVQPPSRRLGQNLTS